MTNRNAPFPRSWLLVGKDRMPPSASPAECIVVELFHLAAGTGLAAKAFLRIEDRSEAALCESARLAVERGCEGVVLAGARDGAEVQKIDVILSAAEAVAGSPLGGTAIVALAGDHPSGVMALASFAGKSSRLLALGGGGEALRRALRLESLSAGPVRQARGLLALAAAQAGVAALAGAEPGLSPDAFEAACRRDRADGFAGKLVATPEEAAVANAVFADQGAGGRRSAKTSAPPSQ